VVESTALEMRHTGNRIGGSNPSLSANAPQSPSFALLRQSRKPSIFSVSFPENAPAACGHLEITVELEPLDLRVQMGGWDHVGEINRHPNITCPV
jgi:hypothetical protein